MGGGGSGRESLRFPVPRLESPRPRRFRDRPLCHERIPFGHRRPTRQLRGTAQLGRDLVREDRSPRLLGPRNGGIALFPVAARAGEIVAGGAWHDGRSLLDHRCQPVRAGRLYRALSSRPLRARRPCGCPSRRVAARPRPACLRARHGLFRLSFALDVSHRLPRIPPAPLRPCHLCRLPRRIVPTGRTAARRPRRDRARRQLVLALAP